MLRDTYLSLPSSRYVRLESVISWVISPFRSERPCIPFLWNANTLSGRQTENNKNNKNRVQNMCFVMWRVNFFYLPILSMWKSKCSCDTNFLLWRMLPCIVTTWIVLPWHIIMASFSIFNKREKYYHVIQYSDRNKDVSFKFTQKNVFVFIYEAHTYLMYFYSFDGFASRNHRRCAVHL